MTMIITGVANTGGRIASLNRFARCSGWTRRLKEPWLPGYLPHGLLSNARGDKSEVLNFFLGAGNQDQSLAELRLRLN